MIAWRNCPRDANGIHGPSFAIGMRVVRDAPGELLLYRGPGYPMHRRNSDRAFVPGFRHQPMLRLRDGWSTEFTWVGRHVLVAMDPAGKHATSLFRDAATDAHEFWYVDVIGPVTRDGPRFDYLEHGLDAVIEPDMSSWTLKDADELEWNVEHGIYTRAEADELYVECKRGVDDVIGSPPERRAEMLAWRPDPSWSVPRMPEGWDAV